jgi:large subunit ribosomal protein L17
MRHLNSGRRFDRDASSRKAMFRNLVANLFAHGEIETTVPKAKEVRRIAERIITKAKRLGADVNKEGLEGAAAARRLAVKRDVAKFVPQYAERIVDGAPERLDVVEVLFREIAPRYLGRPGGYTQIFKTRNRRGDNAEMALLRLVGHGVEGEVATTTTAAAPAGAKAVRQKAPKTKETAAAG